VCVSLDYFTTRGLEVHYSVKQPHLPSVIDILADLVRINSINCAYANGPGEAEVGNYVVTFFSAQGIQTRRQSVLPGRDNILAILPGRNRSRCVLLEAHMDTVTVEGMTIAPFDPVLDNGKLFGRGSCDTKAGLAGMMYAIADLKRSGVTPPCDVWLAAVIDEEYWFRGVSRLCENLEAHAAIVAEPTEMKVVIATKGVLRWKIVVFGKAAHSSKPQLGVNAITHAARLVMAIDHFHKTLSQVSHPLLGVATGNVGIIYGGVQVNFVPDRCSIEIDRRLLPGERATEVLATYQALLDELHRHDPFFVAAMEAPLLVDEALETSSTSAVVQLATIIAGEMGLSSIPVGVPYGSDASKLSRKGIDSIVFGPGSIDQAHAAIEYVDVTQVEQASMFYQDFIRRFE